MEDMEAIKEKIRRCLALGQSQNEHEAMLAMTKARELMARYNISISENDLDPHDIEVINQDCGFSYTVRSEAWIGYLAVLMQDQFGIKVYYTHGYHEQARHLHVIARRCDYENFIGMFSNAIAFVRDVVARERMTRQDGLSYGMGFVQGLREAYRVQNEEHPEYALVLSTPESVQEVVNSMKFGHGGSGGSYNPYSQSYSNGYNAGKGALNKQVYAPRLE